MQPNWGDFEKGNWEILKLPGYSSKFQNFPIPKFQNPPSLSSQHDLPAYPKHAVLLPTRGCALFFDEPVKSRLPLSAGQVGCSE